MEQEINNFNERVQALAEHLLRTQSPYETAFHCAEYMIKEKDRPQPVKIAVSEDEWSAISSAISSLFRVRGTRVNGQEERRGRPKKL